jgi:hypothetical protein
MVEAELLSTLQSISAVATATGVCVAALYYIMTLRNSEKTRQNDIISNRLQLRSLEYYLTYNEVMMMTDWNTFEEFTKKYGRDNNWEAYAKWSYLMGNYDHVGKLLKDKIVEEDQLFDLYIPPTIIRCWEVFEPVVEGVREVLGYPDTFKNFEFLYDVAKKKYPSIKPINVPRLTLE